MTNGLYQTWHKLGPRFLVSRQTGRQGSNKYHLSCFVCCVCSNTDVLFVYLLIDFDASVPIDQTPSTEPLLIAERTIGSWEFSTQ
jgi:hypothetical protein